MAIYLDSARIEEIEKGMEYPFIEGVTCNPILIYRATGKERLERREFLALINQIQEKIRGLFFVQTTEKDAQAIVNESNEIHRISPEKIVIKIPCTCEGLKAASIMKKIGIRTAITAVFTLMQASAASLSGADYVIPFCNRMSRVGQNGIEVIERIVKVFNVQAFPSRILAASIRTPLECAGLLEAGVHDITISYSIVEELLNHPLTQEAIIDFEKNLKVTEE
ncbi:MAG: transaldolase family protein [Candidatus Xenobiia bacterium LiM19]